MSDPRQLSDPREPSTCLSAEDQQKIERTVVEEGSTIDSERAYVEVSPLFDRRGDPTPIPERAQHGSCGDPACDYRHVVLEPHETAAARDRASAAHALRSGIARRYHGDLQISGARMVDVRSLRDLLSVEALDDQTPASLATLRKLRELGVNLVWIAVTRRSAHAQLLVFCEDFGLQVQVLDERLVEHPPKDDPGPPRPPASARASFRRFLRTSFRAKLAVIFLEALMIYGCAQVVSWLLGDGSRLLDTSVSLPVWLVAISLAGLATAIGWHAWRQLHPTVRRWRRRLAVLRDYASDVLAVLDAKVMAESSAGERAPGAPWRSAHTLSSGQRRCRTGVRG
jgi:hypothetical protein